LDSAMASGFEILHRLEPSAFVFKAIIGAIAADVLLLAFILVRRSYRMHYFRKRDARVFKLRQQWDALISGEIPYETWRTKSFDRRIIEDMALDAFEAAAADQSARLLRFLRTSGLIEKRIFEARKLKGWRRRSALVALGRTRAPEGIPALSEALRDHDPEARNAALRGLGRLGSPEAAEEILHWLAESGLNVPILPLQNALINCSRERPQILLPYLRLAGPQLREVLARVLGEVASPSLGAELIGLADDELPELRAAAARALSSAQPGHAIEVLAELSRDDVWFVRLRAVVSMGKLYDKVAIPHLIDALTDSNRLVRMRAAEGLVDLKSDMVSIFAQVVKARDRYGLHAFLAALENADLRDRLDAEIRKGTYPAAEQESEELLAVLRTGKLAAPRAAAGSQPIETAAR
jgi:HEAT repeat protein